MDFAHALGFDLFVLCNWNCQMHWNVRAHCIAHVRHNLMVCTLFPIAILFVDIPNSLARELRHAGELVMNQMRVYKSGTKIKQMKLFLISSLELEGFTNR